MPRAPRRPSRRASLLAAAAFLAVTGALVAASRGAGAFDPARVVEAAAPEAPAPVPKEGAPPGGQEASGADVADLDAYRTHLAYVADGWWWTDNAAYAEEDGGMEAYGIRMILTPGGLASTGCLFGLRDGRVVGPFWYFSSGWDPEAARGFAYQSGPGGSAGFGHQTLVNARESVTDQVFHAPDGTRTAVRHEGRHAPPDTMHDRSLTLQDGTWVPNRTYTWVRRHDDTPPC